MLGLHVYSFFTVVLFVIKKRLGTMFGLVWVAIGLSLLYNILFNHFFATIIKPGNPKSLKVIIMLHNMRLESRTNEERTKEKRA